MFVYLFAGNPIIEFEPVNICWSRQSTDTVPACLVMFRKNLAQNNLNTILQILNEYARIGPPGNLASSNALNLFFFIVLPTLNGLCVWIGVFKKHSPLPSVVNMMGRIPNHPAPTNRSVCILLTLHSPGPCSLVPTRSV